MFNKYSSKCISYILKNKYFKLKKNNCTDILIDNILKTLDDLYKNKSIEVSNIKKSIIPKIQKKNSVPIVFKVLKLLVKKNELSNVIKLGKNDTNLIIDTLKNIVDKNDIEQFYKWYNNNIDKMNTINCLLSKTRKSYKEIDKLIENISNEKRKKFK